MPVEDRKDTIAFIICVNNELYFEECKYYIEHLEVPAGYDIDVIGIWEADSRRWEMPLNASESSATNMRTPWVIMKIATANEKPVCRI